MLLSCGFSLEQCAALMGDMPAEEIENELLRKADELAFEVKRLQFAINFLQSCREELPVLERNVGQIQIEHLPDMWRLNLAHIEKAKDDKLLLTEKQRWLECLPAVHWVSRIPFDVMKQFSSGIIEYDFGLMCYAEEGRALGLSLSPSVERVPGGDYVTMIHRKSDRGPFTWEDIRPMTEYLQERKLTHFGDALSYIVGSFRRKDQPTNYHKLMVKVFT